jgi:hypothetical protein
LVEAEVKEDMQTSLTGNLVSTVKRMYESLMYVSQSTSCMISIRRLDKKSWLGTSSMTLERNWNHYLVES